MFNVRYVEYLFKGFVLKFVVFHCSSWDKEKLSFSIVKLVPCAVARLIEVFEAESFDCRF